jgi:hypothetical protein
VKAREESVWGHRLTAARASSLTHRAPASARLPTDPEGFAASPSKAAYPVAQHPSVPIVTFAPQRLHEQILEIQRVVRQPDISRVPEMLKAAKRKRRGDDRLAVIKRFSGLDVGAAAFENRKDHDVGELDLLVIDNSLPEGHRADRGVELIGGSNSSWEFSAWDSGIAHIGKRVNDYASPDSTKGRP